MSPTSLPDPATEAPKKNLYILYYRQKMTPWPMFGFFTHEGPLDKAISRAKEFCDVMGYVNVLVRPAVINMDIEEKRRNGS